MKKNRSVYLFLFAMFSFGTMACKKQLDVGDPNNPTLSGNVNTESGIISLAQGGVYINGFSNGGYFSSPWGFIEQFADIVGTDGGFFTTVANPDYIIVNGNQITNPAPSIGLLRTFNNRSSTATGNNTVYYQWSSMYALNNACNTVLGVVDGIKFSGDATTQINTIKAWCYWWKGYAYASIGSMYYSGLIIDKANIGSNDYVSHDEVINQSNKFLIMAANTLAAITNTNDFQNILGRLIPSFCQVGNGGVLTTEMWRRNINTMLARNILINKLSPFVNGNPNAAIARSSTSAMTVADWNSVLSYSTNGIKMGDFIFTGRSPAINNFFPSVGGTVATAILPNNQAAYFKISERFIQNFKPGDKRLANNFNQLTTYNNAYVYSTRYSMIDGGSGIPGVYVYGNQTPDDYELIIAGSYEENSLILAEARIRLGQIDNGLAYVDSVRNYLGAGIPPVSGTGLNLAGAMKELTMERRVALAFKGLSFYDSRRWGWSYNITNGGGTFGNMFVSSNGIVYNNVTFNYNFLDYWDVPADEAILNPPSANSVAVKNPNF